MSEKSTTAATLVSMRDVIESDLETFFLDQLDPEATRMAAFPSRDRDAFTSHWTRILGDESVAKNTILFAGDVAGNIVSWEQDGRREVGYWVGRSYWGRGIATEALSRFLREIHERPLHAYVAKHNIGSIRVLRKCGFRVCGEEALRDADEDGVSFELGS